MEQIELKDLNKVIDGLKSIYPEERMKKIESLFRMMLFSNIDKSLDGDDGEFVEEIKKIVIDKIGLMRQTVPLPLRLFREKDGYSLLLFFLYIACFQSATDDGITITTEGRELSALDTDEVCVLHFLGLMVMRTEVSQIKIVNSPISITNYYGSESGSGGINQDIFYGLCAILDYPVMKNRRPKVKLNIVVEKETIITSENMEEEKGAEAEADIESEVTAGAYFFPDKDGVPQTGGHHPELKRALAIVNAYDRIMTEKGIKIVKTEHHIGEGTYGVVKKGKFSIKSKYRNGGVWSGEVAIKTIMTMQKQKKSETKYDPNSNKPIIRYRGNSTWVNTELCTWLQLHGNKYVHPEDFESYLDLSAEEMRRRAGNKGASDEDKSDNKLPENIAHGILPLYFIFPSVNDKGFICINLVSPLMLGSLKDFSFGYPDGKFGEIKKKLIDPSRDGYNALCKHLLVDMLSGLDSMHNNSEYKEYIFNNYLHSDVKPANFLWCLRGHKSGNKNDTSPPPASSSSSSVKSDDFVVLLCDFGFCNKLVNSNQRRQHKIIGEFVEIGCFYTPSIKGLNLERIEADQFGDEIHFKLLQGKVMDIKEDNLQTRLLYGFSEVADFQALALSFLRLQEFDLESFNEYVAQENSGNTGGQHVYSPFHLLDLFVTDFVCEKIDLFHSNGQDKEFRKILMETRRADVIENNVGCSHVSKRMIEIAYDVWKLRFDIYVGHFKKDIDKYIFGLFMPYSIRPQINLYDSIFPRPL